MKKTVFLTVIVAVLTILAPAMAGVHQVVICDGCQKEINAPNYCIEVESLAVRSVLSPTGTPPIPRTLIFCSKDCLRGHFNMPPYVTLDSTDKPPMPPKNPNGVTIFLMDGMLHSLDATGTTYALCDNPKALESLKMGLEAMR